MWWWQSVALAGALSLGASVPADHLTDCAAAGRVRTPTTPATAVMAIVVSSSRRVQSVSIVAPSRNHPTYVLVGNARLCEVRHARTQDTLDRDRAVARSEADR